MLTSLDHIVLVCADIDRGVSDYGVLLGHGPVWRAQSGGVRSALFRLSNTNLEIIAPEQGGPAEARMNEILEGRSGVLTSLAFAADDIDAAHHTLTRRGLSPSEVTDGESVDSLTNARRTWQRFRCADAACAGVKTFILQPQTGALPSPDRGPASAAALDHVVIHTPNPERNMAQYGARLGLRLALDRTAEAFKARFLFYRIGGVTLEAIQRLGVAADPSGPDEIWGITWKTPDIHAAHARLIAAGLNVSEIRTGRKPGTQVFTVKDGMLGIPTLFLSQAPKK